MAIPDSTKNTYTHVYAQNTRTHKHAHTHMYTQTYTPTSMCIHQKCPHYIHKDTTMHTNHIYENTYTSHIHTFTPPLLSCMRNHQRSFNTKTPAPPHHQAEYSLCGCSTKVECTLPRVSKTQPQRVATMRAHTDRHCKMTKRGNTQHMTEYRVSAQHSKRLSERNHCLKPRHCA